MDAILRTGPTSPTFGFLKFRGEPHRGGGEFNCLATVEANDQTYEIKLEMIDAYLAMMLEFFDDIGRMARRGWSGEKQWESEFAEMRIGASSRGTGEVRFDLMMRWPPNYADRWEGTLVFTADAVERFAQRMKQFMRAEGRSWFGRSG